MPIDLRQGTTPVDVYREQLARKEKLLADLRVFKDERGEIVGWEAPSFKVGYTLPDGVFLRDEQEAREWFVARVADGSFDWLLNANKRKATRKEAAPRRLVNPKKFRSERAIERAIENKRAELEDLELRRSRAIEQGQPDKLAGVISKSKAYLEELQVLRTGMRGRL